MKDEKKRVIPRNVDERVMIGMMPFKTLVKLIPLYIGVFLFIKTFFCPPILFIGVLIAGGISYLFSEIEGRETGFQILKDKIRYRKEGNIEFERSCIIRDEIKRITRNEIKKRNN